jgi:carbamoyl-phosphate synthase large subunit
MNVMMSAANSAVAPGIIRHLQKLGHFVLGHDCSPHGYGAAVADAFTISPRPAEEPEKYLNFLASHNPDQDFYLPFLDEELRLPDFNIVVGVNLPISPPKTLRLFTSKILQHYTLEAHRLPNPGWSISGDVIAKPEYGRGGKGHIRMDNQPIMKALAEEMGYHTERFIDGAEYTVDVLADYDGKCLFAVPRRRLVANGVSIVGKIVMDPEIILLVQDILSKFHFIGPINIQIIRERETGKLYIIEINPRLSGSCMFTVLAGFDIIDATIKMFLGQPFKAPEHVREITVQRYYEEHVV